MTEDYLHHVWKYRLFTSGDLKTTSGETIFILHPGQHNNDSGPDFFDARIRIGSTLWAGNVEIHVRASEWRKHRHQFDEAYDNVILHVVFQHDEEVMDSHGRQLLCLELSSRIDPQGYERYKVFIWGRRDFSCTGQFSELPEVLIRSQFDRALAERLERKIIPIRHDIAECNNDWNQVIYRALARNFGFRVNTLPFEWLARNTPHQFVRKVSGDRMYMEALLFGQAGFLDEEDADEYQRTLKIRYDLVQQRLQLPVFERPVWKFSRMRPVNFPTVRLAQFAILMHEETNLEAMLLRSTGAEEWCERLRLTPSDYWMRHYRFGKLSRLKPKRMGLDSSQNIIINSVVPLLFCYGRDKGLDRYSESALELLEEVMPEKNRITSRFRLAGRKAVNAMDTQSQIEMWNMYCGPKKCLNCTIGKQLLENRYDQ
ncbi:MAG: DUF2851 family protein [Flavobacteriales bacterium]